MTERRVRTGAAHARGAAFLGLRAVTIAGDTAGEESDSAVISQAKRLVAFLLIQERG